MKFVIEKVFYFECFHCKQTFNVTNKNNTVYKQLYCPFCGKNQLLTSANHACNKKKFSKIGAANAVVKAFYKRVILGKITRQEQRYYFCELCNSYHLTKHEELK